MESKLHTSCEPTDRHEPDIDALAGAVQNDDLCNLILNALPQAADPHRAAERAACLFSQIPSPATSLDETAVRTLVHMLGGSDYLSGLLLRNPSWLPWLWENGGRQFTHADLREDMDPSVLPTPDDLRSKNFAGLRLWQQKHLVRIGRADLGGLLSIEQVAEELSVLADTVVHTVAELFEQATRARYGDPVHEDGTPARWSIIGLGKLGGSELNFRSDIDLMFVYSADGTSADGGSRGSVTLNEWFSRWAERTVAVLTDVTPSGMFYRVDTRLRPDGASGALVRSLGSYERYYETRGEVWERQMLVKARSIAGDPGLGETFIDVLRPFVFPATMTQSPREEIRRIKNRILNHLAAKSASSGAPRSEKNLKLKRGGLRDIEFIIQCLQMVVGGADRLVRSPSSLKAIRQLASQRVLTPEESTALTEAYRFYRRVEHRLQMTAGHATFSLPDDPAARNVLARQMNLPGEPELLTELARHQNAVTTIYDDVLGPPESPDDLSLLLEMPPGADEAAVHLTPFGFRDTAAAHRNLCYLAYGHESDPLSGSPRSAVVRLAPALLAQLKKSVDPDKGLANLEHVLTTFGAVESFSDLLAGHAGFLELLTTLCSGSQAFTDTLLREPALIDWMVSGNALGQKRTPEEVELVLRLSLAGLDEKRAPRAVSTFRKRETLRAGLLYLLGLADADETAQQLTAVADAIIRRVYRTTMADLFEQRGVPADYDGNPVSLAVVAVGKLGSGEMNFGSDLDIFFVYESDGETTKGRDNVTVFTAAARQIVQELTEPTRFGSLYEADTRLRPEGRSGPLVLSLAAYRNYLQNRASDWERQALTRAFIVTPSTSDGAYIPLPGAMHGSARAFSERLTDCIHEFVYSPADTGLVDSVIDMRQRMEEEAQRKYGSAPNIKTGTGGLVDGEFIAQLGQLIYGREDMELRGKRTITILERLHETGRLPIHVVAPLAEGYATLRNMQMMLRIDDEQTHNVLPPEPERQESLARSLGLPSASSLHDNLNTVLTTTRTAYLAGLEIFRRSL